MRSCGGIFSSPLAPLVLAPGTDPKSALVAAHRRLFGYLVPKMEVIFGVV